VGPRKHPRLKKNSTRSDKGKDTFLTPASEPERGLENCRGEEKNHPGWLSSQLKKRQIRCRRTRNRFRVQQKRGEKFRKLGRSESIWAQRNPVRRMGEVAASRKCTITQQNITIQGTSDDGASKGAGASKTKKVRARRILFASRPSKKNSSIR